MFRFVILGLLRLIVTLNMYHYLLLKINWLGCKVKSSKKKCKNLTFFLISFLIRKDCCLFQWKQQCVGHLAHFSEV